MTSPTPAWDSLWLRQPEPAQQPSVTDRRPRRAGDANGALHDSADEPDEYARRLILTPAADIKPRRVQWLWAARLALGTLGLLAGREGLGKSTLAYWLAAQITRGAIPGEYHGEPRSVLVCATEDSWEHTIVPRLIAAGADLSKVYRVEVMSAENVHGQLSLPRDLHAVEEASAGLEAALLLLDPLMSRLDSRLDTHIDGQVRLALEPLVAMADKTGMAVLGLIHHNKSSSTDPLQLVMASKAFTAVARSVHTVIADPDDETDSRRLFGSPKNNLGRSDLPTMSFTVSSHQVDTDDGPTWTGRVVWGDDSPASISEAMRRAADQGEDRSAVSEAAEWLEDYLQLNGEVALSADIRRDGQEAGHSYDSLKRARRRLNLEATSSGYPRRTSWVRVSGSEHLPQSEQESERFARGDSPIALTALTGADGAQLEQLEQWEQAPARDAPTGFSLPLGAGRCSSCRWHVAIQGHRADCPLEASA